MARERGKNRCCKEFRRVYFRNPQGSDSQPWRRGRCHRLEFRTLKSTSQVFLVRFRGAGRGDRGGSRRAEAEGGDTARRGAARRAQGLLAAAAHQDGAAGRVRPAVRGTRGACAVSGGLNMPGRRRVQATKVCCDQCVQVKMQF